MIDKYMRDEIVRHSIYLCTLSGQDMTDIEAPSPDPDPKVKLRKTWLRTFSKGGSVNENPPQENSKIVVEDKTILKAKTDLFKLLRQKDPREVSRNLRNLLSSMTDEYKAAVCKKTDEDGNTAFHFAAKAGNLEACKLLLESGAELDSRNHDKMNPLQFAARYGDRTQQDEVWKCIEWIIKEHKKLETKKSSVKRGSFTSSFKKASIKEKEKDKEKDKEDTWKAKDRHGFTLLHLAIQNINWTDITTVVEGLTSLRDFSMTDTDERGNNCLHLAAQLEGENENKALCAFLRKTNSPDIKKSLQAENNHGETPLACAAKAGNADSVKRLLEATPHPNYLQLLRTSARSVFKYSIESKLFSGKGT